jgi:hypothetical protein
MFDGNHDAFGTHLMCHWKNNNIIVQLDDFNTFLLSNYLILEFLILK